MIRTFGGVCFCALVLAAAGCGEDEENGDSTVATAPALTAVPAETVDTGETGAETDSGDGGSPEDQPGGAGDEEAARTEVVLEFSPQGLEPNEVRVSPFIPVELIIRSDGAEYDLSYTAPSSGGGANGTTEADFEIDGMRPGQEIEVEERNTDSRARIVASDDVGP